jgi:hypothetical protein
LLAAFSCLVLAGGQQIRNHRLSDTGASLVDVTLGTFHDGWGRAAVETLPIYYPALAGQGGIEMLGYRPALLPAFDWANGRIETTVASDLYGFYATGAGASRVQFEQDASYAFRYATRYQEPAGRLNLQAEAGYALGFGAIQSRTLTSDYQDWNDASFGAASGIVPAGLESAFNTSSSSGGCVRTGPGTTGAASPSRRSASCSDSRAPRPSCGRPAAS